MVRTFVCDGCGHRFMANNTEEERDAESAKLYAGTVDEDQGSCCDACWLRTLEGIKAGPGRVEADVAQEIYASMAGKTA